MIEIYIESSNNQGDKVSTKQTFTTKRNHQCQEQVASSSIIGKKEKKNWEPPEKKKSQAITEAIVCSPQADGKALLMMPILTNLTKLIRTFTGADFMIQKGTLQSARRGKKLRT